MLYLHCKPTETGTAVTTLVLCLADIGQWMAANRLKLNSDKTELLWTDTSSRIKSLTSSLLAVNIGSCTVIPTDNARLLGVSVSADLSLKACLNRQCSVLLPATPATMCETVSRPGLRCYSGSSIRL